VTLALDTSVIIAGLLSWHERHEPAAAAIEQALDAPDRPVLPLPCLLEAYSVMTRLPAPHRISPTDARDLLTGSFQGTVRVVGMSAREVWPLLESFPGAGVTGGATYDAQILACALKAGAERILTFNHRDFARFAPEEIEVVVPQEID
jgi:predicted nucleic acid-binding protein